jgi:hypothetical protein
MTFIPGGESLLRISIIYDVQWDVKWGEPVSSLEFKNVYQIELNNFQPWGGGSDFWILEFYGKECKKPFEIGTYKPPRFVELIEFIFELHSGDKIIILAESVEITPAV